MAIKAENIKTVTVIGAGAMGGGIAGLFANAGYKVHLLDIPPQDENADRDLLAKTKIAAMKKASAGMPNRDPFNATLLHPSNAKNIIPGNSADNLDEAVKASDLVIEVIPEVLEWKQDLFARIEKAMDENTIVTSNTSSLKLGAMTEGRSDMFKKNFALTHFFNPPRFMRLLELVRGPETRPEIIDTLNEIGDKNLGRAMIEVNDQPGLSANRLGVYFMFRAISETLDKGLKFEDVDAVLSKPLSLGKAGPFTVLDQVGIGLTPHLAKSLGGSLPKSDALHKIAMKPTMDMTDALIKDGRTGRMSKTGAGFYRLNRLENGTKVKEVLDPKTDSYRAAEKNKIAAADAGRKGPKAVFEAGDDLSGFSWDVMRDTLIYAANMVPSVTDNLADIDASMKEGYGWKKGPFEILDDIGHEWFIQKAKADGVEIPPALELAKDHKFYIERQGKIEHMVFDFDNKAISYACPKTDDGILSLEEIKKTSKPLIKEQSASLWDIGDGVVCFEMTGKGNALDPTVMLALNESIKLVEGSDKYKAMVMYNDGAHFSLGANLGLVDAGFQGLKNKFVKAVGLKKPLEKGFLKLLDNMVFQGQAIYTALRRSNFPVIGAPSGMALGGGCEMLLSCDSVQAHAETYTGLVEAGVGLLPAWTGTTRVLDKAQQLQKAGILKSGPFMAPKTAFQIISMPQFSMSNSGQDAKKKMWFGPDAGITMKRERLLADAKAKALAMVPGYTPPKPAVFRLPGESASTAFRSAVDDFYTKGDVTPYDVVVADAMAEVVSGDDTHIGKTLTEDEMFHLERKHFMSLVNTQGTKDRVHHMMKTKKPLREKPLQEEKSMSELRAVRQPFDIARRPIDGKPLTGKEEKILRRMAKGSAFILKHFA